MPQLYNLLKEGYRTEAPHTCPDEIYGVMVNCWQDKPEQRPQFTEIAEYFDWMLQEAEVGNYIPVVSNCVRELLNTVNIPHSRVITVKRPMRDPMPL